MSGFSCPTCTTDNSRQDRQGVRTASQLEQKYNGVIEGLDLKVEGLSKDNTQLKMDVSGINASVTDLTGNVNSLALTINGVTITDKDGATRIKGSSIDTSTIAANSITADKLRLTGSIVLGDLATGLQSTISNASSWVFPNTTYIDGSKIQTGTIQVNSLYGQTVNLYNAWSGVVGTLEMTGASSSAYAVELASYAALKLTANKNNSWGTGALVLTDGTYQIQIGGGDTISMRGNVHPSGKDTYTCGTQDFRWADIYCVNNTINTSDRQAKTEITYGLEKYNELYKSLKPVSYKFIDGHRTHIGFISQDVEESLAQVGISTEDFAGFIKTPSEKDGNETYCYALRYGEFIALNTWKIQQLEKRLEELESRLEATA